MKKLLFAMLVVLTGLVVSSDVLAGCGSRGCGYRGGCRTVSTSCSPRPKCCCWVKRAVPAQRHVEISYSCPKECTLEGEQREVHLDGMDDTVTENFAQYNK